MVKILGATWKMQWQLTHLTNDCIWPWSAKQLRHSYRTFYFYMSCSNLLAAFSDDLSCTWGFWELVKPLPDQQCCNFNSAYTFFVLSWLSYTWDNQSKYFVGVRERRNNPIRPYFELIRAFTCSLTCKFDKYLIKGDWVKLETSFFHRSRACYSNVTSQTWLELETIKHFVLVLVTCKFDDD